jgi:hypothetical protein
MLVRRLQRPVCGLLCGEPGVYAGDGLVAGIGQEVAVAVCSGAPRPSRT